MKGELILNLDDLKKLIEKEHNLNGLELASLNGIVIKRNNRKITIVNSHELKSFEIKFELTEKDLKCQ